MSFKCLLVNLMLQTFFNIYVKMCIQFNPGGFYKLKQARQKNPANSCPYKHKRGIPETITHIMTSVNLNNNGGRSGTVM